jgi:hypothetical protein
MDRAELGQLSPVIDPPENTKWDVLALGFFCGTRGVISGPGAASPLGLPRTTLQSNRRRTRNHASLG